MKIHIIIFLFIALLFPITLQAQHIIAVEPLFEYPVAPEEIESLNEKCDYLVKHFWDNFNFKNKTSVDQYALTEAMQVYVTPMRYASKKEVDQSIEKLIGKISATPTLQLQFTKAAEENLFGPRADFWSDELYLKFLDAIIRNKKIKDNRKEKYIKQAKILRESAEGNKAPSFTFNDRNGEQKVYFPMSTPTLLIFGNPDDTDWRLSRLKMDSNLKLDDAIKKGKVNIIYILPNPVENWQNMVSNYNSFWTVGESPEVTEFYDLRLNPSIYLIGSDGSILSKNINIENGVNSILELVN